LLLDVPRGTVSSTTDDGTYYSTVVITPEDGDEIEDGLTKATHITICDSYGTIIYPNLKGTYNADLNTFTIVAGTALLSTATIGSGTGRIVVVGDFASQFPDARFPIECERFWRAYCEWKILKRDSSGDADEKGAELGSIETNILGNLGAVNKDAQFVPILDEGWID
jgi:hypothetical protein